MQLIEEQSNKYKYFIQHIYSIIEKYFCYVIAFLTCSMYGLLQVVQYSYGQQQQNGKIFMIILIAITIYSTITVSIIRFKQPKVQLITETKIQLLLAVGICELFFNNENKIFNLSIRISEAINGFKNYITFSFICFFYLQVRIILSRGMSFESFSESIQILFWLFFTQFQSYSIMKLKSKCKKLIFNQSHRHLFEGFNIEQNYHLKLKDFDYDNELNNLSHRANLEKQIFKIQKNFENDKVTLSQIIPFDSERCSMLLCNNDKHQKINQFNDSDVNKQKNSLLINIINESNIGIIIIDSNKELYYNNQNALSYFKNCTNKNLKQKIYEWEIILKSQSMKNTENISFQREQSDDSDNYYTKLKTVKVGENKKVFTHFKRSQSLDFVSLTYSQNPQSDGKQNILDVSNADFTPSNLKNLLSPNNPIINTSCNTDKNFDMKRSYIQENVNVSINVIKGSLDKSNIFQYLDNFETPKQNQYSKFQQYSKNMQKEFLNFRRADLINNQPLINRLKTAKKIFVGDIITLMSDIQNQKNSKNQKLYRSEIFLDSKKQEEYFFDDQNTQYTEKTKYETQIDYKIENNNLSIKLKCELGNNVMLNFKSYYIQEIFTKQSDNSVKYANKQRESLVVVIEIIESSFLPQDMIDIEQFNYFKQRILSSVSHELKTPLNCSIQLLDILNRSDVLQEPQKKVFIVPALNSNQLLLCMINDIIDFAQIANGDLKLTFTTFNLLDTVRECVSYFTLQAAFKNIVLDLNFDPKIPVNIHSDPMRLKQVIINLLNNAVKFTSKGTISVFVDLYEQNVIKISIADTGCGISSKVGSQIFKGFEDYKKTLQDLSAFNTEGAGLGLTIANNIAKGLGGNRKIDYESELGVGSQFSFFIVNRNKKTKGCYFNHIKIFSHCYSQWKSLLDNSQNISDSSRSSQDITSIKKDRNMLMSSKLLSSKDSSKPLTNIHLSQTDIQKLNNILVNSEKNIIRSQKPSIQQHINTEEVKQSCNLLQYFEQQNYNNSFLQTNEDYEESLTNSSESDYYPTVKSVSNHIQNYQSQQQLQYNQSQNKNNKKQPIQQIFPLNIDNLDFDLKKSPSKKFHKFLNPIPDEDPCNIPSDQSIQQNQNTINNNQFNVTQKKKKKKTSPYQQSKTTYRGSFYNKIGSSTESSKNSSVYLKRLPTTASKRVKDSQIESLQSDIQTFISSSSIVLSKIQKDIFFQYINLYLNSQSIQPSYQFEDDQNLHPQAINVTIRQRRFSQDPSNTIGVFSQIQSDFIKDKNKKNNSSHESLSPKRKKSDNRRISSNKRLQKMQTISEETTINLTRENITRDSFSKDVQLIKNISNQNQNQNILPQSKICKCPKILIVDDNEFNLYALELRLKEQGYTVDKANSGFVALEKISEKYLNKQQCCRFYNLIFMDIDMPQKNGYQTTEEIIEFYKSNNEKCCPISACTAFVTEQDKQKAKLSGMTYYLTKPVTFKALEEILQKVFN